MTAETLATLDAIPRELVWAAIARLAARAMEPAPVTEPELEAGGALLVADEVAQRLHVSRRWVYRHAKDLGAVRLSDARVRFSEAAINKYIEKKGRSR